MVELRGPTRDERPPATERRKLKSSILIFLLPLALISALGGAVYLRPGLLRADLLASHKSFEQLGIPELSNAVALHSSVQPYLARLETEPCDREAILPLAEALRSLGAPRQSSNALVSFVERCKGPLQLFDPAIEILWSLSDFEEAYRLSDRLVKEDPAYARYRYIRGKSAENLGKLQDSLADQIDALALLGNPAYVASSAFYEVTQAYDRLGRHCEAITPIQQWASYDPQRNNPQTRKIIQELSAKGKCGESYAEADSDFTIPATGDVMFAQVRVNGIEGTFVIDTGATFVSLNRDFAERARVDLKDAVPIQSITANGMKDSLLAVAAKVELGPISATHVGVSVSDGLGAGHDGLLGMSFLARFHLSLSPDMLVISSAK